MRTVQHAGLRHSGPTRQRGQGLVEFALVAPVLLLILVVAIDFGRLFFGYVILQNAARIAGSYAAQNPTASFGSGSQYQSEILSDANVANCALVTPIPAPVFVDGPDSGAGDTNHDVGDTVTSSLQCRFTVLTPLVSVVVGNQVLVSTSETFLVRSGKIVGAPTQPPVSIGPIVSPSPTASTSAPPSCLIVPDLASPAGETVAEARSEWATAGFTGSFSPATGSNNKTVQTQTLAPGSCALPGSSIAVTHS